MPTLFGEVFAGFLVGPMMLGWVTETEAIRVLAELGVFFLMFHAGLEFSPDDLRSSFKGAFWVAFGSIVVCFSGVFGISVWMGFEVFTAVFMSLILSVSAVEISARMLKDAKMGSFQLSQLSVTSALLAEVFMLIAFSLFLDVYQTRAFDFLHFVVLFVKVFGYFAVVLWFGHTFSAFLHRFLYKGNKGFTLSLIIALIFGVFAESIGLHFIIGAFLAGLFLQKELIDIEMYDKLEDRVFGLSYSFLGPIFFASLAFHLDITSLMLMPWFVLALFVAANVGKVLGAMLVGKWKGMNRREGFALGLAMNNRGALALILASVGLEEGVIHGEIFSILVALALVSTFFTLLLFKPVSKILKERSVKV
ncbi:MAG: cation:proton antiporter [Candidatus Altimarinota bacterium]